MKTIIGQIIKTIKTILLVSVFSVAMLSIGYVLGAKGVLNGLFNNNSGPNISTTVATSIKSIEELGVLKCESAGVISYDDSKHLFNYEIPFTSKNALVVYKATIKAGVKDLSKQIKIKVNDKSKTVEIQVPEVEVLDSYINKGSLKTYDQTNNVFNPITIDDVAELQDSAVDELNKEFYDSDAEDIAQANLEELVHDYASLSLQGTDCSDYSIEVSTLDK